MDHATTPATPQEEALLAYLTAAAPGNDIQLQRGSDGAQLVRATTAIARRWVCTATITPDGHVTIAAPGRPTTS